MFEFSERRKINPRKVPIVSGGLSERSNTVNNMKLMILAKIRVIHVCSSSPRAASVFCRVIPRCYQQFFWYRYFAGIRFIWRSVFPVGITNLAGTPFFRKRGAGCIKKGAGAPFFLKKGAIAPFLRERGRLYVPLLKLYVCPY